MLVVLYYTPSTPGRAAQLQVGISSRDSVMNIDQLRLTDGLAFRGR